MCKLHPKDPKTNSFSEEHLSRFRIGIDQGHHISHFTILLGILDVKRLTSLLISFSMREMLIYIPTETKLHKVVTKLSL